MENPQPAYDIHELRERMLKHLGESGQSYPKAIEQGFPHVLATMVKLWGTVAMDDYFNSLMVSNRPGRQGFPADAATEIFRLSFLHGSLDVSKAVKTAGWASVSDGEISKHFDRNAE